MTNPNTELHSLQFRKKIGRLPEDLIYIGDMSSKRKITIELIEYGLDSEEPVFNKITENDFDLIPKKVASSNITWFSVCGVHDPKLIQEIGDKLNFHQLLIEDLINTQQRSKIDYFQDHVAIFLRHSLDIPETSDVNEQQIAIILGKNYVFSFTELGNDVFKPIKDSIVKYLPTFKNHKSDYLGYALVDFIVDTYIVETYDIENRIDELEALINTPEFDDFLNKVHQLHRDNYNFRKKVRPLKDIVVSLQKHESDIITTDIDVYLNDLDDHTNRIFDAMETNRYLITNLRENYASELSVRMNSIMMTLTIISTILLPLTFITGLYGMNFANIPELNFKYGYLTVWVIMILIAGSLLIYFRRKGWLKIIG